MNPTHINATTGTVGGCLLEESSHFKSDINWFVAVPKPDFLRVKKRYRYSKVIHSIHPFMDFFDPRKLFWWLGTWVPIGCFGPKQLHRLGPCSQVSAPPGRCIIGPARAHTKWRFGPCLPGRACGVVSHAKQPVWVLMNLSIAGNRRRVEVSMCGWNFTWDCWGQDSACNFEMNTNIAITAQLTLVFLSPVSTTCLKDHLRTKLISNSICVWSYQARIFIEHHNINLQTITKLLQHLYHIIVNFNPLQPLLYG